MLKIVNAAQMREIDRRTIEEIGIPGVTLMENAGIAVCDVIRKKFPDTNGLRVNVIAGKGNNGGDGFVVARHMMNKGAEVTVFLAAHREEVKSDAKINMNAFIAMGGSVKEITEPKHLNNFKLKFMHSTVVVDALLGTGLSSAPRGFYNDVIDVMNSYGRLKVAVDIPSGLSSDSGVIPGSHFNADITVTFGLPKIGLMESPASNAVGELVIADISIPRMVLEQSPYVAYMVEKGDIRKLLPGRSPNSHKGTFGHLLIAGGSVGMGGAVALTGGGALRMGAGLVTACVPGSITPSFETGVREMMTIPLEQTVEGTISSDAFTKFAKAAAGKTAILIGPGITTNHSTQSFVRKTVAEIDTPMVIDADGLNCIGEDWEPLRKRSAATILTPHPGEMGRLLGDATAQVCADRIGAASGYARKTGTVVVLKGAGTVVASPDGKVYINSTGNHGLATGGTGDVLAGMIAGLLAQGAQPMEAAVAAVYIHGMIADDYAEKYGDPRSLTASDLLDGTPSALGRL